MLKLSVFKATVTVVDIDSGAEEKLMVSSQGSAAGLNLKENQRIYFGGLPSIGNYRYNESVAQTQKARVISNLISLSRTKMK